MEHQFGQVLLRGTARHERLITSERWHDMATNAFTQAGRDPHAQEQMEERDIAHEIASVKTSKGRLESVHVTPPESGEALGDDRVARDETGHIRFIGTKEVTYDEHDRMATVGDKKVAYDETGRIIAIGADKATYVFSRNIDPVYAQGLLAVLGKDGLRALLQTMRDTAQGVPIDIPDMPKLPEPEEEPEREKNKKKKEEENGLLAVLLDFLMGIDTETETAASSSQSILEAEAAEMTDVAATQMR